MSVLVVLLENAHRECANIDVIPLLILSVWNWQRFSSLTNSVVKLKSKIV